MGTTDPKRERSEARDGRVQVAKGRRFWPVVDGEEDPAINRRRMLGLWSARAILVIELVYVAVFVAGFASIGNTSDRLPDPYLAIGEILILVMAPSMVCLMLATHQGAPKQANALHASGARMDARQGFPPRLTRSRHVASINALSLGRAGSIVGTPSKTLHRPYPASAHNGHCALISPRDEVAGAAV